MISYILGFFIMCLLIWSSNDSSKFELTAGFALYTLMLILFDSRFELLFNKTKITFRERIIEIIIKKTRLLKDNQLDESLFLVEGLLNPLPKDYDPTKSKKILK